MLLFCAGRLELGIYWLVWMWHVRCCFLYFQSTFYVLQWIKQCESPSILIVCSHFSFLLLFFTLLCTACVRLWLHYEIITRIFAKKKQKYGAFFSRLFSIVLNSVWCLRTVVVSYNNSILKQIFICGFYLSWFSLVLMVFLVLLNAFTMFYWRQLLTQSQN